MKTYHGSCHCGAIQFEADIDLGAGTIRCNCTLCSKLRYWAAVVQPGAFRLLAGQAMAAVYRCNTMREQHVFCSHCGVHPYGIGDSPRWGPFYSVNLGCLDDASADELAAAPVSWIDGRGDNWTTPARSGWH